MKIRWLKYSRFKCSKLYWHNRPDIKRGYAINIQAHKLHVEFKIHEKMNYEKTTKWLRFNIIFGYDENIKFFFRISKLHGLEIAFFYRLFSIN